MNEVSAVISDTHIGDGSGSDEFKGAEGDLRTFLKGFPDHSLVLNGDIFELLKFSLKDIIHAYSDLILELFLKAKIYIAGNHDRQMLNQSFQAPAFMGIPIAEYAIIGDTLFFHGHQFDFANDTTHQFGDTMTLVTDWFSKNVSEEANTIARQLEYASRMIGRNGDPSFYRIRALNFLEHFMVGESHLKKVVIGHTHIFEGGTVWNDRFTYHNSGTWILGNRDFIKL